MSSTGNTYFLKGSWNVICDRCGEKYKAGQIRKEWTGLMVCEGCWEPRHPQDFIRTVPDTMSVPYVRPRPADIFIGPTYNTSDSIVNVGLINGFIING